MLIRTILFGLALETHRKLKSYMEAGVLDPGFNTLRIDSHPGYGEYFQGAINEVGNYNYALSDAELSQLFM